MKNLSSPPNPVLHSIDSKAIVSSASWPLILGIILGALVLGIVTGFGANYITTQSMGSAGNTASGSKDGEATADGKNSAGILDKDTFSDTAEGTLKEGGFEGEGSFHLERPGGKSQNVYLTSTTVDLSQFLDKKVRVWGATFSAEKAGWLMDVGYIEVIE